jgi:hypothetical protein
MRRIEFAPLLAALGGLLLLLSLFLHWYQPGLSAWTVFEVWDLVLAALALGAMWVALANAVWEAPLRDGALSLLGGAALVIVVSQLINHPPAAQGASLQSGAWLGLGGAALIAAAGALSAANVSLSLSMSSGGRRERQRADEPPTTPLPRTRRGPDPATEAAAVEPEVHDELYPAEERTGPIGADDPEMWKAPEFEGEVAPFDHESDERS